MRSSKAKTLLVALLVLVVVGFGVAYKAYAQDAGCEPEKVFQRVTSPDGHWEAVVAENICEGAFAFTAVALYDVVLVSKTNAADRHFVFSTDDGGHLDHLPTVAWLNQKSLQVTIVQSLFIGLQDSKSAGFDISYKIKN
jgi:hypothetical protein